MLLLCYVYTRSCGKEREGKVWLKGGVWLGGFVVELQERGLGRLEATALFVCVPRHDFFFFFSFKAKGEGECIHIIRLTHPPPLSREVSSERKKHVEPGRFIY